MQILLNTDRHLAGSPELAAAAEASLGQVTARYGDWLTRVEVYLKDVNSVKGGHDDIECTAEARPRGREPVAVTQRGATPELALDVAADALLRALERAYGRLEAQRREGGEDA